MATAIEGLKVLKPEQLHYCVMGSCIATAVERSSALKQVTPLHAKMLARLTLSHRFPLSHACPPCPWRKRLIRRPHPTCPAAAPGLVDADAGPATARRLGGRPGREARG
jgi:hypothetical protein